MKIKKIKIFKKEIRPHIRTLKEMKEVIYDKEWFKKEKPAISTPIYYMCRGIYKNEKDKKTAQKNKISFDVTIMPPRLLGREFVKTKGHYHLIAAKKLSYPEIYEVLRGEAIFLLQKMKNIKEIEDVMAIKCRKGEKVLIPPNYGHIFINPTNKLLKTANWVLPKCQIYEKVKKMNGFCYFALKGNSGVKWVRNKKYKKIPKLRFKKLPIPKEFQIPAKKPIYNLINTPLILNFLNKPEKYSNFWQKMT